jgi:solute carrier family 25, member 38
LYFTSLNTLRQLVADNTAKTNPLNPAATTTGMASSSVLPKISNLSNLLTGATARVVAGTILMPVTVIKVRYESNLYTYKSIAAASKSIYATEGIRGFFSGWGATAVRDAPYAGLYVVFYEGSKTYLSRILSKTEKEGALPATTINASSGVIAAALATAITNPFDAVKTRLQLMPSEYNNMLRAAKLMVQREGIRGFFDGLGLRMGRKACSSALAWSVYEELVRRGERRLEERRGEAVL